jgi:hypothetical protein
VEKTQSICASGEVAVGYATVDLIAEEPSHFLARVHHQTPTMLSVVMRYDDDDNYDDDDYDDRPRRRRGAPHRGTLILILGILGFLICGLCGVAAWIMGSNDLAEMKAGRMDSSGRDMTQIGYVLGIISTVLMILSVALFCLFFMVGMAGGGRR